ncbi:Flavin-linked sulfhydryl oxidase of the mitochondrial IMS [Neocucurbitaria cava]|uniref:Sulfhydryl oxidase n=1 Tax=Neocucurbitaria cava TaxID=798079 RepID=A0A9W9CQN2_9PLEO|nr:Flavin-linked sulfhydryl oxidase of the mitochondrial IMS [Neocucurbitaria cava]
MAPGPVEIADKQDAETAVPKKLSKGIVLGPDGKPCRTCNDVASLFAMAGKKGSTTNSSTAPSAPATTPTLPADCPPDVEALGRSSWTLLHSITATYPATPTPQLQSETKTFLSTFGKLYPCWFERGVWNVDV